MNEAKIIKIKSEQTDYKENQELNLPSQNCSAKFDKPCMAEVPDTILSPPTSRSSSPVQDSNLFHQRTDTLIDLKLDDEDIQRKDAQIEEDQKIQAEAFSRMQAADPDRRYQQLMHLLEKSSIYTGFLLEKIKAEEAAKKMNEAKVMKIKSEQIDNKENQDTTNNKSRSRRGKRKNAPISEVIDKEALIKRQRLDEKGDITEDKPDIAKEVNKLLQPKLLTGAVLRDYQLYGVNWITTLYDNGMNGILADEMGLGKTIQSIGLIANLLERGLPGPFIVVVPLSTLSNWKREFDTFAPAIPTVLFHGTKLERPKLYPLVKKQNVFINGIKTPIFPVLITSYEMVIIEFPFLSKFSWKFIIVDEGHRIKNLNCALIKHLKGLKSDNRLLLTGTPLQNNLSELWSLLNFILPDVFDDLDSFQMWFDFSSLREDGGKEKIIANEKQGQVLSKLHQILSPFLLRRLKTDVELKIPPKTEVHVYATMSPLQERYYKAILERRIFEVVTSETTEEEVLQKNENGLRKKKTVDYNEDVGNVTDVNGYVDVAQWNCVAKKDIYDVFRGTAILERGRKSSITSALKVIWVQLKKCCNHPYLINYPTDKDGYAKITDEVLNSSGKMLLLDRMLPTLLDNGHKVLLFSTMTKLLDIIEDYLSLFDWKYCRLDGSMSLSDRSDNVQRFQNHPDYKIFLLSTRAGGLGLNLMAADTVIILDSDWNPQCDLQAQDRAHRIGQTRKVMVYRFLTKNTMDQKIVERGISKRFLEKMVIHKGKFKHHDTKGSGTISETDLQELFDCEALEALQTGFQPQDILSDADLAALTDRDSPLPKSAAYTVVEGMEGSKL